MKTKQLLILAISFIPFVAHADITIDNHTSSPITGKVGFICSSYAGESRGVVEPHNSLPIPQSIVDDYCKKECTVKVYASKNCGGDSIATVVVDQKNGIDKNKIQNHNSEGYVVSGSGDHGYIDGGPSWYDWIF
ncbi:MAG: hypothetical protein A3F12_04655 [Gammaproteobacteria bacterium RIFCSPHIGHO2_12_FULL_38_14]|nr:MAG: hypothetical protein A3F12_04655 [Gammaproteobacteria bacterium RIFCSPHIGHO2_12_FULL_38_14]